MPRRPSAQPAPPNPLLAWRERGFPDFAGMEPEHLAPAFEALERQARAAAREAAREEAPLTWRARYEPVERAWTRFDDAYRVALAAAMLREEPLGGWEQEAMDRWDDLNGWLGRHRGLAKALKQLQESPRLLAWQRRVLKAGRFGGWAWEPAARRERKVEIDRLIKKRGEAFDLNLRLSCAEAEVAFTERSDVAGLRPWLLAAGRQRARQSGRPGWVFTAQDPDYATFMADCESRESRRLMYRARASAASELSGDGRDNGPIARALLRLRREKAGLFEKPDHNAHKLEDHMLSDSAQAEAFLSELCAGAAPAARKNHRELFEWARDNEGAKRLEPWDRPRAEAALSEERFGDCEAQSMAYLAVSGAIERSVATLSSLLRCRARRERALESSNLMVFEIRRGAERIGRLSVSPFATSERREGGMYEWDLCGALQGEPEGACAMVFMQMPKAARMGHFELTLLFHELGHAFHALLARPRCAEQRAGALEWDAIETHSMLFEQLAWEPSILRAVGRRKGKPMPAKLINTLRAARNFHSGASILRQANEALCDLRLHGAHNPRGRRQPWEVFHLTREEVGLGPSKSYNREGNHLWALSSVAYASARYAYLWSEALATAIYERWREDAKGKLASPKAAERLERLLFAPGSSQPMASMIRRHLEQKQPALDAFYRTRELNT